MGHFAVMAIGADRPGILAALAGALAGAGANLEDVSSTILRGHFASMLVVDAPEGTDPGRLERSLAGAVADLEVTVLVRAVRDEGSRGAVPTHVLVAYGADRPGIVARLASLLASRGANLTDVTCRVISPEQPVYTLVAELELPAGADPDAIGAEIRAAAEELGVDVTFRPVDVETL